MISDYFQYWLSDFDWDETFPYKRIQEYSRTRYQDLYNNPCLTAGEDVKRFRKQAGFKKSWRSLSREGTGVTLTKSYLWYPNHLYRRLCLLSIHVGSMWTWIHHLDCVSRDGKPAAWKYKPFLLKIQLQPTSIFGLVYKLITSSLIHHVIFKARHVTYCKISDITIMTWVFLTLKSTLWK